MATVKAPDILPGNFTGWDTPPFNAEDTVVSKAREHGVDEHFARAIAKNESKFDNSQVSPKGAQGIMQLMPATSKGLGVDPTDPVQNIDGGVRELKRLLTKYGGDHTKAMAAYNAGEGTVDRYGGVPPYKETQDYVARVSRDRDAYAKTAGGGGGAPDTLPGNFTAWDKPPAPAPSGQTEDLSTRWEGPTQPGKGPPAWEGPVKAQGGPLQFGLPTRNVRTGKRYTSGDITQRVPVIDAPTEGVQQIQQGVKTMQEPGMERKAKGGSEIFRGGMKVMEPVAVPAIAANAASVGILKSVLPRLIAGTAAGQGTEKAGEALGVPEGYRQAIGDVVGTGVAGTGPQRIGRMTKGAMEGAMTQRNAVGAAAGAFIGNLIDGPQGAKTGAMIGGGIPSLWGAVRGAAEGWKTPIPEVPPAPKTRAAAAAKEKAPTRAEMDARNVNKKLDILQNQPDKGLVRPGQVIKQRNLGAQPTELVDPEVGVSMKEHAPPYLPPEKSVPTATTNEANAMRSALVKSGQLELPGRTPRPLERASPYDKEGYLNTTGTRPLQDAQVSRSLEPFDAPSGKAIKVNPDDYRFEPKGKYKYTPGDNPYGASGKPTMRGEFVPPEPEAAPVVEKQGTFKLSPKTQRLLRSGGLEDTYGEPGTNIPRKQGYRYEPPVEKKAATPATKTTDTKGGGTGGAPATPPGGPPPPPAAQTRKPTGPPPPPVQTPKGTAPGKKLTRAQMAAAKKLKQSLGGDKSDDVLHIEPPKRNRDYASENRDKVVTDYLEASGQQRGITPEVYQKASPEEQAAIEASVRAMPSSHRNRGGYSDTTKQAIIDALKGLKHGGVIKPMALGGVIQTISAQKPQIRRSRRGIAYGPPHLLKGKNPPPVPLRSKI